MGGFMICLKCKMRFKITIVLMFLAVLATVGVFVVEKRGVLAQKQSLENATIENTGKFRIVSLVPSITETLYMLELSESIVGVSRFCNFPPAATNLPTVGGLTDASVEAIVRLKPTHLVASSPNKETCEAVEKFGIKTLIVDINSLNDIYNSVWKIAEEFNATDRAEKWLANMEQLSARISENVPKKSPKVLICAGRDSSSFDRIYAAGEKSFYADIIRLAGGVNACELNVSIALISAEGVMKINPDIIIDIVMNANNNGVSDALNEWAKFLSVKAVEDARVYVVEEEYAVRPGPRIGLLLERVASYIQ